MEMTGGEINKTELVASLISQKDNMIDGIEFGRTPILAGRKAEGYCATFKSYAYQKLRYTDALAHGPDEIDMMMPEGCFILAQAVRNGSVLSCGLTADIRRAVMKEPTWNRCFIAVENTWRKGMI